MLFHALGKVIQLREIVECGRLGPKFNIKTNVAYEKVKLAMNEAINISLYIGLGRGIS
jgi:hypothetical protein